VLFAAGEIAHDGGSLGTPFVFTQVGEAFTPVPLGTLDPSSNLFSSPSPGVLQYVGDAPLRVRVSYSLGFLWTAGGGGTNAFSSVLVLNGAGVGETLQVEILDTGQAFSASSDTMLVLQPGDELQVGVSSLVEDTITIGVQSLTIVANRI
jgi:hypothetical protein